jgi:hypothetical protein
VTVDEIADAAGVGHGLLSTTSARSKVCISK